jgi:hypothetical protein
MSISAGSISVGDTIMLVSEWHDIVGPESAITGLVLDKDEKTCPAHLTIFLGKDSIVKVYEDQVALLNC